MLTVEVRDELAADLAQAERSRVPIAPLTTGNPDIDVVDAYEIQLINIRQRVAEGARVIGHKVGLSSKAMQEMMGVDEPDYGHLLDEMQVFEDRPVPPGRYLYPRVEVEVGFVLADDLPGEGCTEDDVLAATAAFAPAIELIDTRIRDWKIKLCDTIADNASSAGWVLGEARVSPKDIDITSIDATLTRNGEVVAKGRSDAVLGNPVTAVAWLARKVDSFGVRLKAGDIVLPGSCTKAFDANPGRRISSPTSTGWARSTCRSSKRSAYAAEGIRRDRRVGQHQHRSAVQAAAVGVAGAALDGRHRPGERGSGAGAQAGSGDQRRGCGLAAGPRREAGPGVRGHQRLRAPRRRARNTPRRASARST